MAFGSADLILWRHADSKALVQNEDGRTDFHSDLDRPLTPKGIHQAERVSRWMSKRLDSRAQILASPSLRTRQTASFLQGKRIEFENLLYDGSPEAILARCNWPDLLQTTVLVGHQPILGQLAGLILTGISYPLVLEKGALMWFRWKKGSGGGFPVLISAATPEFLSGRIFD